MSNQSRDGADIHVHIEPHYETKKKAKKKRNEHKNVPLILLGIFHKWNQMKSVLSLGIEDSHCNCHGGDGIGGVKGHPRQVEHKAPSVRSL